MKEQPARFPIEAPLSGSPRQFFRDIEIEFLIHELKDPISIIETGIRTVLERREKYGPLTARQEKTLKRTLRNSKKAWVMLNDLLEIGRSEGGCFVCSRFQPAKSAFQALQDAMETMAGSIFEELGTCAQEKETWEYLSLHKIFWEVAPEVHRAEMLQDETKFRQIAGNLFKNALHHRQSRMEIKMEMAGRDFTLTVFDDGPGVDAEHQEMIFKRYTQVKECSILPRKGHGLGLAGALILARCLGGDIHIDSRRGQGATFRLTLPTELEHAHD
ncbi:MAG: HAMP domain-containing histidine kinase [Desulfobacterales bacterium]|nr:MAG: HAMP domain-containing histidine kinase [Desulfobacterales bacterium]